jgi:ubiquinone/menaquinone biosynthesis C-methylase UbiE
MADELDRFQSTGLTWAERAGRGELDAVLSPTGGERRNLFLHHIHLFGASRARSLIGNAGVLVDFGCGTGRFLRFWSASTSVRSVVGTEITPEMLYKARSLGLPSSVGVVLTDGLAIPFKDASVDAIWCSAVLRYSLFVPNPVYGEIAQEMFRVLRPGGVVANCEMYVYEGPEVFCRDFEAAGFKTAEVRVLNRYARLEQKLQSSRIPLRFVPAAARMNAMIRYHFDRATRKTNGLRDYLFVWKKSDLARAGKTEAEVGY